jgi:transcriptional regulator with XRE-family HTH domain
MKTEGERIKYFRKEVLHVTLDRFGEKFGVKKSILSSIENGNAVVTDQMRKSICIAYGISEEWLKTGAGDIYATQDRRERITAWVNNALAGSPENFRFRFITLLAELPDEWWAALEEKALEIFAEEQPEAAPDIEKELEAYRRELELEKSREESSFQSRASGE